MTDHPGLPVAGYQPQSDDKVQIVNRAKELEERVLRHLDSLSVPMFPGEIPSGVNFMLGHARQHIVEGFMWANRAVFQPSRVKLPEDSL